ncbi:hypothetical protein EVAR_62180_1 [Eumeta japonica]|uniref:Uncharacterized protein n=1 Tax=Eumeta variegata TaxID=151549 RepID=A0A4C1ZRA1_EUMVA|nr:hypothetical protein EVAR_62180_1 [Eumeta japonica]
MATVTVVTIRKINFRLKFEGEKQQNRRISRCGGPERGSRVSKVVGGSGGRPSAPARDRPRPPAPALPRPPQIAHDYDNFGTVLFKLSVNGFYSERNAPGSLI